MGVRVEARRKHIIEGALDGTGRGQEVRNLRMEASARLVCTLEGKLFAVMAFIVRSGKIAEIDILRDPERLSQLDRTGLDG